MAQPLPPPQPPPRTWYAVSAAPRPSPDPAILLVAIMVVLIVIIGMGTALFGGIPGMAVAFLCIPILVVIAVVAIAFAGFSRRRTIPPPPPIQQRMVPAGQQGPVALDCPNCGGPPTNVDRFGIAVCAYCGTRFLVR